MNTKKKRGGLDLGFDNAPPPGGGGVGCVGGCVAAGVCVVWFVCVAAAGVFQCPVGDMVGSVERWSMT
jgi:hypothetical protein